jgi:hypothetical protein
MNILFLSSESDLRRYHPYLANALHRQGAHLLCVPNGTPENADIRAVLAQLPERPSLILHLEFPAFPLTRGLTDIDIPTACFQIDTYTYTHRRILWSMLFDHPMLFHPGFPERFCRAGHPGSVTFYHAAARELFEKAELERVFDVGWVGRIKGRLNMTRRRVLPVLARNFQMNEWWRYHTHEELADTFRRSKVVLNIARDDYPQDANMRAFDAMAGGALLINRVPTELTGIGFEEGIHFLGYRNESEIAGLVRQYLDDKMARLRIAKEGQAKVMAEHTFDRRAEQIIHMARTSGGDLQSPARRWPWGRVQLAYMDFFAANECLRCAYYQWKQVAMRNPLRVGAGGSIITRAWARRLRGWAVSQPSPQLWNNEETS